MTLVHHYWKFKLMHMVKTAKFTKKMKIVLSFGLVATIKKKRKGHVKK